MSHGVKNAAYFCLIKHRSLWEDYLVVCPLTCTCTTSQGQGQVEGAKFGSFETLKLTQFENTSEIPPCRSNVTLQIWNTCCLCFSWNLDKSWQSQRNNNYLPTINFIRKLSTKLCQNKISSADKAIRWILTNSPEFAILNSIELSRVSQRGDLIKIHLVALTR